MTQTAYFICELCQKEGLQEVPDCGHFICPDCFAGGVDGEPKRCVQCLDAAADAFDPDAANYCNTCGAALRDRMETHGQDEVEWITFCPECDTQGDSG